MDKKRNNSDLFVQIVKFGFVGGAAFVIDYGLLIAFTEWAGIHYFISAFLSFSISVIFNYIASIIWVFNVDQSKSKQKTFIIFIVLSILGLLLNQLIMWLGVEVIHMYYLYVKIIATALVMVFNFITRKIFLEEKENGK